MSYTRIGAGSSFYSYMDATTGKLIVDNVMLSEEDLSSPIEAFFRVLDSCVLISHAEFLDVVVLYLRDKRNIRSGDDLWFFR